MPRAGEDLGVSHGQDDIDGHGDHGAGPKEEGDASHPVGTRGAEAAAQPEDERSERGPDPGLEKRQDDGTDRRDHAHGPEVAWIEDPVDRGEDSQRGPADDDEKDLARADMAGAG